MWLIIDDVFWLAATYSRPGLTSIGYYISTRLPVLIKGKIYMNTYTYIFNQMSHEIVFAEEALNDSVIKTCFNNKDTFCHFFNHCKLWLVTLSMLHMVVSDISQLSFFLCCLQDVVFAYVVQVHLCSSVVFPQAHPSPSPSTQMTLMSIHQQQPRLNVR